MSGAHGRPRPAHRRLRTSTKIILGVVVVVVVAVILLLRAVPAAVRPSLVHPTGVTSTAG